MDKYELVSPNDIIVKERLREHLPELGTLTKSIEEDGIVVPLLIKRDKTLVDGARRLASSKILGLKEIPVVIKEDLNELQLKKYELIANLFRESFTPAEEVYAWREVDRIQKEIHGDQEVTRSKSDWSLTKTAEMLGRAPSGLSQDIALADAMDIFPELKDCKTKDEARKLFNKITERLATDELLKRDEVQGNRAFKYAKDHYNIGDAIEGMKSLDQTVASFAEVDPSFGIELDKKKKTDDKDNIKTYSEIPAGDYIAFVSETASELYRITGDNAWVVWWFGIEWYAQVLNALSIAGFNVDKIPAIWNKVDAPGQTQQPELYLGRAYEPFFICRKGSPIMKERGRGNVFSYKPLHPSKKIHSTEKPIELYQELIDIFCYPGCIAAVPFLGSGAMLRALYMNNMTGFGWDLSREHKQKFLGKVANDLEEEKYG